MLVVGSASHPLSSQHPLTPGSMITGGLSRATPEELANPGSVSRISTGQRLRIIGQCIFFVAIFAAYIMVGIIGRKAQRLKKAKEALWWIAATAPFLILRGIYGILSSADWQFSYYLPTNVSISQLLPHELTVQYGANGLKQKELVAEYIMSVMTEAITLALLLRAVWLVTMPKHLFVPYDQRNKRAEESIDELELSEGAKGRQAA